MTTIITRSGKGTSLSWNEVDANFDNLNTDKAEVSDVNLKAPSANPTFTGTVTFSGTTSGLTSSNVGLGNVDNTSDATKNSATVTLTNKTLTSPKNTTPQFGVSATASENHFIDDTVANQLIIKRGTPTSPGNSVLKILSGVAAVIVPCFSARLAANQSVTTGTWTKVNIDTVEFDSTSAFASNKYTPQTPGYYLFSGIVRSGGASSITSSSVGLAKNGSVIQQGGVINVAASANAQVTTATWLVQMNGTTDYVELWGITSATTPVFQGGTDASCRFNGHLVSGVI